MKDDWHGLLLFDKPSGPTSHDVVARVRRITGERRIGHSGTLDPLASGLLPLVIGRATRLVRFLPHSPKSYRGDLRLGVVTVSDDCTGEVTREHQGPFPEAREVIREAGHFVGAQLQAPPAVSARKVGGRRMYRLTREGVQVEAEPRQIQVDRFHVEAIPGRSTDYRFEATVSAGTYIRGIVRDLGKRLGCGAVLTSLRRTSIASMEPSPLLVLEPELPSADDLRRSLIPLEHMPLTPPPVELTDPDESARFCAGGVVPVDAGPLPDGPCRVLGPAGELLGIAELCGERLKPRVVLAAPGR